MGCQVFFVQSAQNAGPHTVVNIYNEHATISFATGPASQVVVQPPGSPALRGGQGSASQQSAWKQLRSLVEGVFPAIKTKLHQQGSTAAAYVRENFWSLLGKSAITGYVYVNYVMFRLIRYLADPERWIYWQRSLSLSQLIEMSHEKIIAELSATQRYRCGGQDASREELLQEVLGQLDEEYHAVSRYLWWSKRIHDVDDVQHRCVVFCEGCIPPVFGVPVGALLRYAVHYCSARRIVYLNDDLLHSTRDTMGRLQYLMTVVLAELRCMEASAAHSQVEGCVVS